jgi:hypothetical protein
MIASQRPNGKGASNSHAAMSGDVAAVSLTSGDMRWIYVDAPEGSKGTVRVDPVLHGDRLFVG